jgi:hypothetical protein
MPADALATRRPRRTFALPPLRVLSAIALCVACSPGIAQTLAAKARESGCVDAPRVVESSFYRCTTASGAAAYFNVPNGNSNNNHNNSGTGNRTQQRRSQGANSPTPAPSQAAPTPGFPRVDAATQKGRDELRRKVLQDELAAEEKLLLESRSAYANGAPPVLADEQNNPQRYAERIAKLRQAVLLHERNVEALRRELGLPR